MNSASRSVEPCLAVSPCGLRPEISAGEYKELQSTLEPIARVTVDTLGSRGVPAKDVYAILTCDR